MNSTSDRQATDRRSPSTYARLFASTMPAMTSRIGLSDGCGLKKRHAWSATSICFCHITRPGNKKYGSDSPVGRKRS